MIPAAKSEAPTTGNLHQRLDRMECLLAEIRELVLDPEPDPGREVCVPLRLVG